MIGNDKVRMAVNRIMSFLIGGLLVLVVMNMTVVSKVKEENTQLAKALDASQYEPGRILADAKAQFANREFSKVAETLTVLFEKHPGSSEATEGKGLYDDSQASIATQNAKWEAAVAGIRARWAKDMTAQLRERSEKARLEMEKGLEDTLNAEWEKIKGQIRQEWAKQG
jgi:primase-polymerase (primpol)-like protein